MHPIPTPPVRRAVLALALGVLATACATAKPAQDVVFPPPPDKARIKFVRTIATEDDIDQSAWRKITNVLVPRDNANALLAPTSLALSPDEAILYAALPNRGRVVAVDLGRRKFTAIGAGTSAALARPVGVAVDGAGVVYVTDKPANAVVVFSPDGKLLRKIGREELVEPTGIAIDRRNQILYVVNDAARQEGRHTIEAYSLSGKHLRTLGGGRSDQPGYFNFPRSVAVSRSGELHVVDMLNFRIQVFDAQGNLMRFFGQAGASFPGQFDKIHGVAFDTFDNVYVADAVQGVHILSADGAPLMMFGPPIARGPSAIAIDSKNTIYVGDLLSGVHEFKLVNTTADDSRAKPAQPAVKPAGAGSATAPAKPGR